MVSIDIDKLASEITQAVRQYTEDVSIAVDKKVDEVANEVLEEVKTNHPYKDRTGDYTEGFKITKQDVGGKTRRVVWNKKHYRRVHLLEFGHAKVNGGRVPGKPHLRPAYDRFATRLPEEIKNIIKNGG